MRFYTLFLILLLSPVIVIANESKLRLPADSEQQIDDFYKHSSIDSYFTLAEIIKNNPELYPKVEEAHVLTEKVLSLYNYDGYFKYFRQGINKAEPIDKVTFAPQKAYLECLHNNVTSEKYAQHLLTYSRIYVNSISDEDYKKNLLLLDNIYLHQLLTVYGKTWEDALQQDEEAFAVDQQLILELLNKPETVNLFNEFMQDQGLSALLNLPMVIDINSNNGLVQRFTNGTTAQCLSRFNRILNEQLYSYH